MIGKRAVSKDIATGYFAPRTDQGDRDEAGGHGFRSIRNFTTFCARVNGQ
jgi:hypothetical protein